MVLRERLRHVSIGVRLVLVIAVVIAVSLTILGAVSLHLQHNQTLERSRDESLRLGRSLESSLRVQMLRGDTSLGDAVTRGAGPGAASSVRLLTHHGRVRYATRKEETGRQVKIGAPTCAACHAPGSAPTRRPAPAALARFDPRREIASSVTPIVNEPACARSGCHPDSAAAPILGLLEVELSYAQAFAAQRRYWLRTGLVALGLVVLTSLVVVLLIRRWVVQPVRRLVQGTRTIASGDLDHSIPEPEGELGELARAFNAMQTRLKTTQQQIVMSEKLASVGKLAAGVAHEINNPLTGILTFAEELHEDLGGDEAAQADLAVIRDEALRCREIVRRLLDFSRRREPSLQRVQMADVFQRTLKLVAKLAPFHDVTLEHDLPAGLPEVMADPGQLQQVFLNLLINATEAMPEGGRLVVSGSAAADQVQLAFADTGHGITIEQLDRIFEPFFSTKGGKTSGLGLAVSWSIIERHGGRLEVAQTGPEGTTFLLTLPSASAAAGERA